MNFDYSAKSVLIVEKSLDDLSALRELLQVIGFKNIHVASSVNMALQLMHIESFDVCLASFDLGKNEKTGLQLLSEAKESGLWSWAATFVLVVDPERSSLLFGSLENSADVYISKPYDIAVLRSRLERIYRVKHVSHQISLLMDKGEFDKAIAGCEQLAQRFPGLRLHLYRMRGIILLRQEKYSDALSLFQALLSQRDLPWAKVGAGIALSKLGQFAKSFACLNEVLDQGHVCAEAYHWAAVAKLCLGERSAALMMMRKAVMLQPSEAHLRHMLGDMALMDGAHRIAVESYRAAIRFGKDTVHQSADAYFGLARALAYEAKAAGNVDRDLEAERVGVLESVVHDFGNTPYIVFLSRLCAADVMLIMGQSDLASERLFDAWQQFDNLPLTDQARNLCLLELLTTTTEYLERLDATKARVEATEEGRLWHSLLAKAEALAAANKAGPAFTAYKKVYTAHPEHHPTLLNMVTYGLKALPSYPDQQVAIRFYCQKALLTVHYGGLLSAQHSAYKALCDGLFSPTNS